MSKKNLVLTKLQEINKAISLPELIGLLGEGFAERSVRRWLNELVTDNLVIKIGQKRGTKYQIKLDVSHHSGNTLFGSNSLININKIKQPIFKRKPVSYNHEWLEKYEPNVSAYLPASLLQQLEQEGTRNHGLDPIGTYARKIFNRLLIDLSYNSSRLEGNTYSLIDTQKLILEGINKEGSLNEEKIMILNHKEAIRHLVDFSPNIQVNFDEICTLHYLLAEGLVPQKYCGKVRDHIVRISASTYITLEGEQVLTNQLNIICEKAAKIQNPFEQSIFLLIHVAYLQAFTDVNKRTARLSANIPLIQHNLVPLSFNDISKDDYISAMLAIYELNDIQPIVELYQFSYLRTCSQYDVTIEAIGFDEVRVRFREERRNLIRDIIAKQLVDKKQNDYVEKFIKSTIPSQHQKDFLDDLTEDLQELSHHYAKGMGITKEQIDAWLKLKK